METSTTAIIVQQDNKCTQISLHYERFFQPAANTQTPSAKTARNILPQY